MLAAFNRMDDFASAGSEPARRRTSASAPADAELVKPRLALADWPTKRRQDAYLVKFVTKQELRHVLHTCDDAVMAAGQVAARQRAVIHAEQLQALGVSRTVLANRRRHGLLHSLFRGTYLWGGPVPPHGAYETAAILVCRGRVALGLQSTLALWGVAPPPPEVAVLRLAGRNRSRPGLVIHRTTTLRRDDLTSRFGLPTATPLRALLDLAADGHPRLEKFVSDAHAAGVVTAASLNAYTRSRAGLPGIPLLRELAGTEARGYTRSENERRLRALCRAAGLPQPRANRMIHGWEADFFWPDLALVVEIDAINTHGDVAQFDRDRRKQRTFVAAGLVVLRFTDRMLHGEPLPVIADLAQAMARRRQRTDAAG